MTTTERAFAVTILHEGVVYDPFGEDDEGGPWDERGEGYGGVMTVSPEVIAERDRIVREGVIFAGDEPMPALEAARLRHRLLGSFRNVSLSDGLQYVSTAPRRFLIPGLWAWGHIPMLGGPPKAGKTTLIADLVASLLVPGRRFLDHFEPADLTQDERHGTGLWVVVINAETPAEDFENALRAAGVIDDTWITLAHLEEEFGGASAFDLRIPEVYERWLNLLVFCSECRGGDDVPPSVVIVDGLTAILGSDTTAYGEWYAQFRKLMKELGVPNALVTAHNGLRGRHLMQGVESMAQADGLWNFFTDDPDGSNPARYFSVTPRLGGLPIPKTRVRLDGGRLRMQPKTDPASASKASEPPSGSADWAANSLLNKLRAAGAGGLLSTALTGRGRVGGKLRDALDALNDQGKVRSQPEGQGRRWFLVEQPPSA